MPPTGVQQYPEIRHLWVWVNEPQHGTAVQAVFAIVTTVASIIAVIAALWAYFRTVDQVKIANQQLRLTRKQASAAQRPFLVVEREQVKASSQVKGRVLIVHNKGEGPVTDCYWIRDKYLQSARRDSRRANWRRIGSISRNGRAGLRLPHSNDFAARVGTGIWLHYKDLEGSLYACWCKPSRLGPECDNRKLRAEEPSPLRS